MVNVSTPIVPWITRRDLHAWMWAQPIRDLAALFGTFHLGWLCGEFTVNRPPRGYFNRKAENRTDPNELDALRDPDEPVPLINYEFDGGSYTWRGVSLPPYARLGPPTGEFRDYVRHQTGNLAVAAVGARGQLVRCRSKPLAGPPIPLTKGILQRIVWRMESDEADEILGVYGLTRSMVPKLVVSAGVGFLDPAHLWNASDWSEFGRERRKAEHKRIASGQKKQVIALSPEIRADISAEVEREKQAHEARKQAQIDKRQAAVEWGRQRALERMNTILKKMAFGRSRQQAFAEEDVDPKNFAFVIESTIKDRVSIVFEQDLLRIARAFRLNRPMDTQDLLLLFYVSDRGGTFQWKEVISRRYKRLPVNGEPARKLVAWLLAAGEVSEASQDLAHSLEECRLFLNQANNGHLPWPKSG